MSAAIQSRSPMDQLEDAIINAEGSAFLLSLLGAALPEGGEDYDKAMTIVERFISQDMAALRKAFNRLHDAVVKGRPLRNALELVHTGDDGDAA